MDICTENQQEGFETCNTKNKEQVVIAFVLFQCLDLLKEITDGILYPDFIKCFKRIRQKLFELENVWFWRVFEGL